MTLREILCTSCSDVALSVDESRSAQHVVAHTNLVCCLGCEAPGRVEMHDDGEHAMLSFRPLKEAPIPFTIAMAPEPVNTLVGDILWLASAEFGRQRAEGFVMQPSDLDGPLAKMWAPDPTTQARAPGCVCHWEEGDSPCPVHGLDEEAAANKAERVSLGSL